MPKHTVYSSKDRPASSTTTEVCRAFRGLAFGLAFAVRPAALAEVSSAQRWVLKIVSAKRSETIFGCP
jgi:hypothetical protein